MSSIPYRPRKSHQDDISPTYYDPTHRVDTKSQYSTSNKGTAGMASTVDRFPFIHDKWGYPEPGLYNAQDSFKQMVQKKDVTGSSGAFNTTSRDNYFYQTPFTQTPDPGTYHVDHSAAYRLAQIRNERRAYEKAKRQSQTQQLIRKAAEQGKSIARYLIESDPNYVPPPPPFSGEALERRPVNTEVNYQSLKGQAKRPAGQHNIPEINKIQSKYNLKKVEKSKYLAGEIQAEIDRVRSVYSPSAFKRNILEQQTFIEDKVNQKCFPKHLNMVPLEQEGISFNTRITNKAQDCINILEEQRERLRYIAPNSYDVNTKLMKKGGSTTALGRQLGRYDVKTQDADIPGVGSYNIQLPPTKQSFLVNEDNKFVP